MPVSLMKALISRCHSFSSHSTHIQALDVKGNSSSFSQKASYQANSESFLSFFLILSICILGIGEGLGDSLW